MNWLLAQAAAPEPTFWGRPPGDSQKLLLAVVFVIGMAALFLIMRVPTRARRPIVWTFTFLAGSFFVLSYLWPEPIAKADGDIPRNFTEGVGFWIVDATPWVAGVANILTTFLLGLGIFSLVKIHLAKFVKRQKDWSFSLVLLLSILVMTIVGYVDWYQRQFVDKAGLLSEPENWNRWNQAADLLFDGLIQQMDAAMFSLIAFFILSAAYRAFRIRSIEATVMMASALILMLSLMGAVDFLWSQGIDNLTNNNPASLLNSLKLTDVATWVKDYMQVPSLRALDFGVGLGALAMGLRIWLGLERGGISA